MRPLLPTTRENANTERRLIDCGSGPKRSMPYLRPLKSGSAGRPSDLVGIDVIPTAVAAAGSSHSDGLNLLEDLTDSPMTLHEEAGISRGNGVPPSVQ